MARTGGSDGSAATSTQVDTAPTETRFAAAIEFLDRRGTTPPHLAVDDLYRGHPADLVVLLFLAGSGNLEVAASRGLSGDFLDSGEGVRDPDLAAVRQLLEAGPTLAEDSERWLMKRAQIPGHRVADLLLVPLRDGSRPFGLFVVGGHQAGLSIKDPVVRLAEVSSAVRELTASLHAWWLLCGVSSLPRPPFER
jgi:hypothetical protein